MYDTIIIGAGMSGLAAGIRLAHFDQRVCILERHSVVGGLNSYYRLGGRDFDVGLHALTNFTPRGERRGPLARLLRQLRLRWDDLALAEQIGSEIAFPEARLRFSNDPALLESEIARCFPDQREGYRRLVAAMVDYDELGSGDSGRSARAEMARHLSDPLLVEMLLCPLLFYGGPRPHDMDFHAFCILFRSIFLEGLARPPAGVRLILRQLAKRFTALGGELRLRSAARRIVLDGGRAKTVELEDGSELTARRVLSSAGWNETMRLCRPDDNGAAAGGLSFVESISVLDAQPRSLGLDRTIVFFNDSPRFDYREPDDLVDARSGVVCSPNNFAYNEPLAEGMVRITTLANFDRWAALDEPTYRRAKLAAYDRLVASAVRFVPDFRPCVIETDLFTPKTIHRFTGHDRGAVYGSPRKQTDGRTPVENLFVCGTDQGLVGIIGALLSGVTIANRYLLGDEGLGIRD
ncbi:MAG: NAD(P)/FAD-dependent oxidoreductase [Pirellulales bacterium]|nr:NAD(P)/FAD-dependent oxidoreductase [Pirellulales bacterium]